MTAGTCRICSCTEQHACAGGCRWTDETKTLCDVCLVAGELVDAFLLGYDRLTNQPHVAWAQRLPREQQHITMLFRGVAEVWEQSSPAQSVVEEVTDLMVALRARCPDQVEAAGAREASLTDLVLGLLDAPRVVLAR